MSDTQQGIAGLVGGLLVLAMVGAWLSSGPSERQQLASAEADRTIAEREIRQANCRYANKTCD